MSSKIAAATRQILLPFASRSVRTFSSPKPNFLISTKFFATPLRTSNHHQNTIERMILPTRSYSSLPTNNPRDSEPETDAKPSLLKPSVAERLKAFFRQYGKLGFAVYMSVSAVTLGSIYLALSSGIDIPSLLVRLGVPEREWMKSAGTFAVAYAIYKVLLPLRLFVVAGLTRSIAKRLSGSKRI